MKHHCLIKPKEKYKNRIAELRRLGYREKEKALVLRSKMLNFPRRTLVVGKAVFLWAGNRFSLWEKLFIQVVFRMLGRLRRMQGASEWERLFIFQGPMEQGRLRPF